MGLAEPWPGDRTGRDQICPLLEFLAERAVVFVASGEAVDLCNLRSGVNRGNRGDLVDLEARLRILALLDSGGLFYGVAPDFRQFASVSGAANDAFGDFGRNILLSQVERQKSLLTKSGVFLMVRKKRGVCDSTKPICDEIIKKYDNVPGITACFNKRVQFPEKGENQ